MRIVFMGTPAFAVPSLAALLAAGYPVVGVFTQPDRPAGRGKALTVCPVKRLAQARGVPVFQFERIRRREGRAALRALAPDLMVTAAFGQILSQAILDIPPLGTINVHASLLPKYRGAAPINRAIMMGEEYTGVTTMFTDAGIDTGDMALCERTPIGEMETAGELTERLAEIGARVLLATLRGLEAGTCPRIPQNHAEATHQGVLTREDGLIDWQRPAQEIARHVRGLNPWPCAYAQTARGPLKIWLARPVEGAHAAAPGTVIEASAKRGLIVACGSGALEILELQASAAKRMAAKAYLMGKRMEVGAPLGGAAAQAGADEQERMRE